MSPIEKVEAPYNELVAHYESGEERESRAAAKLLLVSLDKLREHGGANWMALLDEYITLIKENPDKFEEILHGQRASDKPSLHA
jgi:hypothetical protein